MFFRSRRVAQKAHHDHEIGCTSLCCAKSGQKLCVTQLCGGDIECAKLRELGVREGADVTVLRHGNPILISIDDARFGIGQKAATNILCNVVNVNSN